MLKRKGRKELGKIRLSQYFQTFNEGDKVAIKRELSLKAKFPRRLQGKTGIVVGKRGKAYIISMKDYSQEKRFIIEPIHLKKIKGI